METRKRDGQTSLPGTASAHIMAPTSSLLYLPGSCLSRTQSTYMPSRSTTHSTHPGRPCPGPGPGRYRRFLTPKPQHHCAVPFDVNEVNVRAVLLGQEKRIPKRITKNCPTPGKGLGISRSVFANAEKTHIHPARV